VNGDYVELLKYIIELKVVFEVEFKVVLGQNVCVPFASKVGTIPMSCDLLHHEANVT